MSRKMAELLWLFFQAIAVQVLIPVGMGSLWLPFVIIGMIAVNLALVHRYVRIELGNFKWGGFEG